LHNREKILDVHVCHLFEGTSKKWQDAEIDDLTEVWFVQSFANSPPSWTQPMKSGLSYKNIMESESNERKEHDTVSAIWVLLPKQNEN